jgi:hypothetical protein
MITVNTAVTTAKPIKKEAMKIVVYIVALPKNSMCRPMTTRTIPMSIQLS